MHTTCHHTSTITKRTIFSCYSRHSDHPYGEQPHPTHRHRHNIHNYTGQLTLKLCRTTTGSFQHNRRHDRTNLIQQLTRRIQPMHPRRSLRRRKETYQHRSSHQGHRGQTYKDTHTTKDIVKSTRPTRQHQGHRLSTMFHNHTTGIT